MVESTELALASTFDRTPGMAIGGLGIPGHRLMSKAPRGRICAGLPGIFLRPLADFVLTGGAMRLLTKFPAPR